MAGTPRRQPVFGSINRPLTVAGTDRRLFFVAIVVGAATFTLFGSLLGGALMFLALYLGARAVTQRDPQLLRIILRIRKGPPALRPGQALVPEGAT